jgi:hypothetical protein
MSDFEIASILKLTVSDKFPEYTLAGDILGRDGGKILQEGEEPYRLGIGGHTGFNGTEQGIGVKF